MAWLLVDNYDSFTYNLVDLIHGLSTEVEVVRNDELDFSKLGSYEAIVLSPGPGLPEQAGGMMHLIDCYLGKKPILGVCLGMQALALRLGDRLVNQIQVKHGIQTTCTKTGESILIQDIPETFAVGLYHSWRIEGQSNRFTITSRSEEGVIMSIENEQEMIFGVQFHPESIMTPDGQKIMENFQGFVKSRKL